MKCTPTNKKLWKKAKAWADRTYKRNSAYKSLGQSKHYKKLGGKWKCK